MFVIAVRRDEARDLHMAFLVFQLFDSYPGHVAPGGGGLPYKNDGSARRTF